MNESQINWVLQQMQSHLDCTQMKLLGTTLHNVAAIDSEPSNLLDLFLSAKEVEGCSPKTIVYYERTIVQMSDALDKPYTKITTDDLRQYLGAYERERNVGKVTIDNIRRILSSFFAWLEDEEYIVKSPVRRIHHVKTPQRVKTIISDEEMERIREITTCERDLAIVDMLASTGMRIGELVGLNISDVNIEERECIVFGKGGKQRFAYFDARTKIHLANYLATRSDNEEALFVSLYGRARRVTIGGIESRLRSFGKKAGINGVHPHKFRRTLATNAINKGMPIEQVQKLLGHAKIDTTMHYALVKQENVRESHRKYLE